MKLCRFGPAGQECPGIVDGEGRIRDLSANTASIGPAELSPQFIKSLCSTEIESLPIVEGNPRLGPPISGTSKFICIGLNYIDHARESGAEIPLEPVVFMKATSAIAAPNEPIVRPIASTKLDWEVELGVVIGSTAQYVERSRALDHVAGYCVVNDISERAFQMQSSQWDKGKGCDTFGPIGPWLVTADEIENPQNLDMWLTVNGEQKQKGNTSNMIFDVAEIVSYLSRYMTLLPGDIISTGTPAGVGMGQKPEPIWLRPGDIMELGIEGLGRQRQRVVAHPNDTTVSDKSSIGL